MSTTIPIDSAPPAQIDGPRPGFYERRILPKILDVIMDTEETRRVRAEVCAPLVGEVLEIGFGTGHNLPYLPPAVTRILAVDPMERGRVLEPGGTLHFVEHGLSPDARVSRWQRRLNRIQQRIAGGCSLDRDTVALLEAGGLHVDHVETYYLKGDPKLLGWTTQGRATAAEDGRRSRLGWRT